MRLLLLSLLSLSACIAPRSIGFGQMGEAIGRGATEVGVMSGFVYASQTTPPVQTTDAAGTVTTNSRSALS